MGCGHPSSWSGANRKAIRGLPRGGQLEGAHHDKRMAKIVRHARGSKFKLRQNPLYRPQQDEPQVLLLICIYGVREAPPQVGLGRGSRV